MNCKKVAEEVYNLAISENPLAPLVKEALDVIDDALDTHGCVLDTQYFALGINHKTYSIKEGTRFYQL